MGSMIQGAVRYLRGTNCKLFGKCGDPLDPALGLRLLTLSAFVNFD
jgi:hypothetical protein